MLVRTIVASVCAAIGFGALAPDTLMAQDAPSFASSGKVVFCTDATFPPMEFFESTGDKTPTGFDIDFMTALADKWRAEPDVISMDFAGLLPSLEANRCDAIISGVFVTPERTEKFDAVPYLVTRSLLISKGGAPALGSLDELSGKVVAVQTGTEYVKWFEEINADLKAKGLSEAKVQLYPKASDGIQQVLIGRAFAATTQDTELAYRNLTAPGSLSEIYAFENVQRFGVYFRKDGSDKPAVEAAVEALREDGSLTAIAEKWRFSPNQLSVGD